MAEEKTFPLSVVVENAKGEIVQAVNRVSAKSKLPAFLFEGIILDVLSEIRNRKNLELVADINAMNNPPKEQKKEKGD